MPEELPQSLGGCRRVPSRSAGRGSSHREPPSAHRGHVAFSPLQTCWGKPACFHQRSCPAGELIDLASCCATQARPDAGLCPVSIRGPPEENSVAQ